MDGKIDPKIGVAVLIGTLLALNAVRTVASGREILTVKLGLSAFVAGALMILISTLLTEKTGAKGLLVLWLTPFIPVFIFDQINQPLPHHQLIWGTLYVALLGAATTDYFIEPEAPQ